MNNNELKKVAKLVKAAREIILLKDQLEKKQQEKQKAVNSHCNMLEKLSFEREKLEDDAFYQNVMILEIEFLKISKLDIEIDTIKKQIKDNETAVNKYIDYMPLECMYSFNTCDFEKVDQFLKNNYFYYFFNKTYEINIKEKISWLTVNFNTQETTADQKHLSYLVFKETTLKLNQLLNY